MKLAFSAITLLTAALAFSIPSQGSTPRICMTGNTSAFYAPEKRCLQVTRQAEDGTEFQLTGHLVKAETDSSNRPTLVIVPGGPGDSGADMFLALENRSLPGAFYKHLNLNTLYYDPRGTGASEIPNLPEQTPVTEDAYRDFRRLSNRTFSTKNNVEDLKALLDHAGLRGNVILLSHSAGGAIALKFAELHPEYLSGLILYNSISSLRETGDHIRAFEGDEMWKSIARALTTHRRGVSGDLLGQFRAIEDAVINEKLLLVREQREKPELLKTSIFGFRHLALQWALASPERFQSFLDVFNERLAEFPEQPKAEPVNADLLFNKRWFQSSWLKATMHCSEALTEEDKQKPFVYPGIKLDYLCKDVKTHPTREYSADLSRIQTRTLVLTGKADTSVPWPNQKRLHDQLSNSRFQLIEGAGHNFHNSHTMDFYKAIEAFTKPEVLTN